MRVCVLYSESRHRIKKKNLIRSEAKETRAIAVRIIKSYRISASEELPTSDSGATGFDTIN